MDFDPVCPLFDKSNFENTILPSELYTGLAFGVTPLEVMEGALILASLDFSLNSSFNFAFFSSFESLFFLFFLPGPFPD